MLGRVKQLFRTIATLALAAFSLSIGWVIFYGQVNPPETVLMGMRAHQGTEIQQNWIPLSKISPHLIRAVIAAEDTKFCRHHGFDLGEMKAAWAAAEAGASLRGASTITQQTAKNAFLWPGRNVVRKGSEAWFTVLIEVFWSKERTLEVYLNVAEWGDGVFGIEAASQASFNKSAADLSAREASLLAAILPSPRKWQANPPGPYVATRAQNLRRRMAVVREQDLDACVSGILY